MPTQIKRVRFFDGQFLKEVDFRDEQNYHLHMRRRMNFFLFGQSGVIQIGSDELKFFALNNTDKTFRVRAGMAICRNAAEMEGKEVILLADSPAIDLDSEGITTGGRGYVTVHFDQEEVKDPPSEGDVDANTRYRERAVLDVHPTLPGGLAPSGEEYIVLGFIDYNTMAVDYSPRMEAKLRNSLYLASPVITTLSGTTSATAGGASVTMTINGTNLAGALAVNFSDPNVTAVVNNSTSTAVNVTVTANASATGGTKTFTVTTPAGVASSPIGVVFTVNVVPAPTVAGIAHHSGTQTLTVNTTITGTNLNGATAVNFSGTGVTAVINTGGSATSLPITITIASSAATGARTFSVVTPGGSASSVGVTGADFAVLPAPTVNHITPTSAAVSATIEVHGSNIRDPALGSGSAATGTLIQLAKGVSNRPATNATVRPDAAGRQVVQITIPSRTGTPWVVGEVVDVQVIFNNVTFTLANAFTYTN